MNQSVKRASTVCPNGLPALDDYTLATRIAALPLLQADHDRAVLLTCGLIPGKFGLLKRADRDWLMKMAVANDVLPRIFKKKKKRPEAPVAADRYLDDHTEGTEFGLALRCSQVPSLGGKMPVPPRRAW